MNQCSFIRHLLLRRCWPWLVLGLLLGSGMIPTAYALDVVVLEPRTPPNGRGVRHDLWDQPEAIWTCKIIPVNTTIFDACGYEELFPLPEPPPWKRRLADKDAVWICIANPVELSPIQARFVKGNCLFTTTPEQFAGAFQPTPEQLSQTEADYQRLMRARLVFDPEVAQQYPALSYYLKEQKLASKRAIIDLGLVSGIMKVAAGQDRLLKVVNNALEQPIRVEIEHFARRASDPVDPNFREIVALNPPTLASIPADPPLSSQTAIALNHLRHSLSQMIGLSQATLVSFDRASGAKQAGEREWELRQLAAARMFDAQYAQYAHQFPNQLAALGNALQAQGVTTTITVADVITWQNQLPGAPFSPTERAELQSLGLNQADIEAAAIRMAALNPDELIAWSDGKLVEALTNPTIPQTFADVAIALQAGPVGAPWLVHVPLVTR